MGKEDIEELKKWLVKIRESQDYIVVEGKNDKIALVRLGVNPNLVVVFGMPPYELAEDLSRLTKKAIVLVDLDKEGKKIFANLRENLVRNGVQVDRYFRQGLFKFSELSHIEGAYTYFRNLGLVD